MKKQGFSLMEMMIVLLITAIIAAATAPLVSKKMMRDAGAGNSPWLYAGLNGSIVYNPDGNTNKTAMIGAVDASKANNAKFYIESNGDEPQMAFAESGGSNSIKMQLKNSSVTLSNITNDSKEAVAIGYSANICGQGGTAIGYNANSTSNAISVGHGASASSGGGSVALGNKANAGGMQAVAIGQNATAGLHSGYIQPIAIGSNANITGYQGIAMGAGSNVSGHGSVGLGYATVVEGRYSTVMGSSATASGEFSVAMGNNAATSGDYAISLGSNSTASSSYSAAIGYNALATGQNSLALGANSNASGKYSMAIGRVTTASSNTSLAVGYSAQATGYDAASFGYYARALGSASLALGYRTKVTGKNSTAIGYNASTSHDNEIVLGDEYATVYIPGNVVVGKNAYLNTNRSGSTWIHTNKGWNHLWCTDLGHICMNKKDDTGSGYYGWASDRRLKNIGTVFNSGLEQIKKLEVFNYTYKNDPEKTPRVGVIAQDLQKVFPNAVMKGKDGFLRIRWEDMFYAMINAIKELDTKTGELRQQNKELLQTTAELKKENEQLEARIAKLEKQLSKIEK